MFTGIIEELGQIKEIRKAGEITLLTVSANRALEGMKTGDSVCVCGVCLTVIGIGKGCFSAELSKETVSLTTFQRMSIRELLNLERPLTLESRLSGHIVTGHIDGTGEIISRAERLVVKAPEKILDYIAVKGSVAIDGVSLTVVEKTNNTFSIVLIPHTSKTTTLGLKKMGETVNIEVDILARYVKDTINPVRKGLSNGVKVGGITNTFLREKGF